MLGLHHVLFSPSFHENITLILPTEIHVREIKIFLSFNSIIKISIELSRLVVQCLIIQFHKVLIYFHISISVVIQRCQQNVLYKRIKLFNLENSDNRKTFRNLILRQNSNVHWNSALCNFISNIIVELNMKFCNGENSYNYIWQQLYYQA